MRIFSFFLCSLMGMVWCTSAQAILIESGVTASYRFDLSSFGVDAEINSWVYDGPPNSTAPSGYDFLDVGGGFILEYGTSAFASDITQFTFISSFSIPAANLTSGFGPRKVGVEELFISISYFNDNFTLPGFAIRIENDDPSLPSTKVNGEFVGERLLTSVSTPSTWVLCLVGFLYFVFRQSSIKVNKSFN